AVESIWGYCLIGRISRQPTAVQTLCTTVHGQLENLIRRFWEVEEPPSTTTLSEEDQECETHFQSTVARLPTGKYVVQLPFKSTAPPLGESRQAALLVEALKLRQDLSELLGRGNFELRKWMSNRKEVLET
ncbi:hypothetical protein CBL_20274, partial [Carabus blaptoides fortunei]